MSLHETDAFSRLRIPETDGTILGTTPDHVVGTDEGSDRFGMAFNRIDDFALGVADADNGLGLDGSSRPDTVVFREEEQTGNRTFFDDLDLLLGLSTRVEHQHRSFCRSGPDRLADCVERDDRAHSLELFLGFQGLGEDRDDSSILVGDPNAVTDFKHRVDSAARKVERVYQLRCRSVPDGDRAITSAHPDLAAGNTVA